MASSRLLLLLVTLTICETPSKSDVIYEWDENGYVLYCPCMGRFGNQAAHFLGSLAFAKMLNRTLAIPPWRSYVRQHNVPFTDFFRLDKVQAYHRSLPLNDFMTQLAPTHWPPGNRTGYCHSPSPQNTDREDCGMKKGNPFGPFWDELSVDFDRSEFTHMTYAITHDTVVKMWRERYHPLSHPVLAFKGAPASYPVLPEHRYLQKFVRWNSKMEDQALSYINKTFGEKAPFIAIHLRMGSDWEGACKSAVDLPRFMESVQCLEKMPGARITPSLCLPSLELVVQHLTVLARKTSVSAVFVASDVPGEKHGLQQRLGSKMKAYHLPSDLPQLDLAIMAKAYHFVGNCLSSISAFVKRERDFLERESDFFGLDEIRENYVLKKAEL